MSKFEFPTETGRSVYERTYSRTKPDGSQEDWPDTVKRVVDGNISLVDPRHIEPGERDRLIELMTEFKAIPAGRHLWTSGIPRTFPMNCWASGWGEKLSEHFAFSLLRLGEGGGVGANYSSKYVGEYEVRNSIVLEVVCREDHPDFDAMWDDGLLSCMVDTTYPNAIDAGDSRESWAKTLAGVIDTATGEVQDHGMALVVVDVSNVRPKGQPLKNFGGYASGPEPFVRMLHKVAGILNGVHERGEIEVIDAGRTAEQWNAYLTPLDAMAIDHAIAECIVAGGNRRSARMSIVNWDDPYIEEFLACKSDSDSHWTTNISVGVDEGFFQELEGWKPWRAEKVLNAVCEGMLHNGEPGFVNLTKLNEGELNEISITNPCMEIGLEEWEPCNLGHVNLDAFYNAINWPDSVERYEVEEAHRLMARFLIRATFAGAEDPKSRAVLDRNRRVMVGHLGFAGMLAKNGIRYSESHRDVLVRDFLRSMYAVVRRAARDYCFELRIPECIKVSGVAPTGTVAKMPGVTEGAHPVFYRHFIRRIRFSKIDPGDVAQVEEYRQKGYHVEDCLYAADTSVVSIPTEDTLVSQVRNLGIDPRVIESSDEISVRDKIAVNAAYQKWYADNSVSYTVNLPVDADVSTEEMAELIREYLPRMKGLSAFPAKSRPQAPYECLTEDEYLAFGRESVGDSVDLECSTGACPIR